jgi:hypothetical protein
MNEHYIIEYLNCEKNFQKDFVQFKGLHAYEEAVTWGKKNLENFNMDMIHFVGSDENTDSDNYERSI